jgi:hypothetical protein
MLNYAVNSSRKLIRKFEMDYFHRRKNFASKTMISEES